MMQQNKDLKKKETEEKFKIKQGTKKKKQLIKNLMQGQLLRAI
jgi:hypothetical protein